MKPEDVQVGNTYTETTIRYNTDMTKKPQKQVKVTKIYYFLGRKKVAFEVLNWGETGSRRKGTMAVTTFCDSFR